jgi:hypothetical protein
MTTNEINIAIAEACGWSRPKEADGAWPRRRCFSQVESLLLGGRHTTICLRKVVAGLREHTPQPLNVPKHFCEQLVNGKNNKHYGHKQHNSNTNRGNYATTTTAE